MDYVLENKQTYKQKQTLNQNQILGLGILECSKQDLSKCLREEAEINPLLELIEDYGDTLSSPLNLASDRPSFDKFLMPEESTNLYEHLKLQLSDLRIEDYSKSVCKYIVYSLDERGYLETKTEDIASHLGIDEEEVLEALRVIWMLEPIGVGARDLKECLMLQAKMNYRENDNLVRIIEEGLELVAKNKVPELSQRFEVSVEEVNKTIALIKRMNPIPAQALSSKNPRRNEEADIIVIDNTDNQKQIIVNQRNIPRPKISTFYKNILQSDGSPEAKEYLRYKLSRTLDIINSLERRNKTLKEITEVLLQKQAFLTNKDSAKSQLSLSQIANELNVNVSTVSRAVKDKYIKTEIGLFSMESCFTSKISNGKADHIINMMCDFIREEDKKNPYSDSDIERLLKEKGVEISRRTVAKYRNVGQIPPKDLRKIFGE